MCFGRRPIHLKAECSVVRVSIETVGLAVHLQDVDVVGVRRSKSAPVILSGPQTPVHWLMGRLVVTKMKLRPQHWLKTSKGRSA